ncbi:MAG TPA: GNAT family N-acetyltransferase [Mycobacteriales bacterium]|nr:GNAT family N-acetyltransferase [Mycobacteriales bacterium]
MTDFVVREATIEEILALRKAVLRPEEPVEPSDYDATPQIRHVGAFAGAECIGCATVFPSPYADPAGEHCPEAWQLRGMAVAPERRGTGVGRRVLDEAVAVMRAARAPLCWANARAAALPFYMKAGWRRVGEEFRYGPARLPHYVIVRTFD